MVHILVVEDQILIALLFQSVLEGAGHRVTVAADGLEALDADDADPADLLVTDCRMPRMGGLELIRRMRSRRPGLPVILVSGGEEGDPHPAADGRTVLLDKPVSPRHLIEAVADLRGCTGTVKRPP